jgi:hypothetical protein
MCLSNQGRKQYTGFAEWGVLGLLNGETDCRSIAQMLSDGPPSSVTLKG